MSLIGKFYIHFGKEYLHHGEVIAEADSTHVLIKIDGCGHAGHRPETMHIIPVAKMAAKLMADGSVEGEWDFFNSREELNAFMEYLDIGRDGDDEEDDVAHGSGATVN
jgi:hypothetical protein